MSMSLPPYAADIDKAKALAEKNPETELGAAYLHVAATLTVALEIRMSREAFNARMRELISVQQKRA